MKIQDKRNSNIELLRILSMIMILAHHFIFYGVQQNFDANIAGQIFTSGGLNRFICLLLLPGGVVGVAIFFMISGYFGIESDKAKFHKTVIPVFLYAIFELLLYIVICNFNGSYLSYRTLIDTVLCTIFPVGNNMYWFATAYIVLMAMKPVLNQLIRNYKRQLLPLVCVLFMAEYMGARLLLTPMLGIIEALFYYVLGACLKLYENHLKECWSVCYLAMFISGWALYIFFTNKCFYGAEVVGICIFGTISAIGLFCFFQKRELKSGIVNSISRYTFDVYLLHEYPYLRKFLWKDLFKVDVFYRSKFFPFCIFYVALIYLFFLLIAVIFRKIFIDKLQYQFMKFEERLLNK